MAPPLRWLELTECQARAITKRMAQILAMNRSFALEENILSRIMFSKNFRNLRLRLLWRHEVALITSMSAIKWICDGRPP